MPRPQANGPTFVGKLVSRIQVYDDNDEVNLDFGDTPRQSASGLDFEGGSIKPN